MKHVRAILMAGTLGAAILFPLESLMPNAAAPAGSLIRAAAAGGRGHMSGLARGAVGGSDAVSAPDRQRERWREQQEAGGAPAPAVDMPTATAKPAISAEALHRPTLFEFLRGIARD